MSKRHKHKLTPYFHSFPSSELILPINVYNKMLAYAQCSPGEISGFGKIIISADAQGVEKATVTEVRIFKQKVTGAHTTIEEDTLHKWLMNLVKTDEDPSQWNLWWHSHYNFGVFFSGTDAATISQLSKQSTLFSLCINQAGDMTARKDINDECTVANLKILLDTSLNWPSYDDIQKEVKELITHSPIHYGAYAHNNKFPKTTGITPSKETIYPDPFLDRLWGDRESLWANVM